MLIAQILKKYMFGGFRKLLADNFNIIYIMEEDFSKYNGEGTMLRKAQLRMLDILVEVDKICRKHNIPYWIDYGTLLGAVRHGGFIPWDDDVDICVMGDDYTRLRKALLNDLPEQFVFQDSKIDSNAFFYYGRVRDKNSYFYYPYFVKLKEQGMCVDVFRVDKVVSPQMKEFVDYFFRRSYREIHNYGNVAYNSVLKRLIYKICAYAIHPFALLGVWLTKKLTVFSKKHYLALFTTSPGKWFIEDNVFPLTEVEFEGHRFFAPSNIDAHLKMRYGDYMNLPKEEDRKPMLDVEKMKIW